MSGHLPTGTVTFLFTDIEGSTQLWERFPQAMPAALSRHDELLAEVIERHHGRIVKNLGDGIYAVFRRAGDAVAAAVAAQVELGKIDDRPLAAPEKLADDATAELNAGHSSRVAIKVRMGLHTGEAELREGDYHGSALNRAERLMSAGHGGQILLSATTAAVCEGSLPAEATLRDLGEHRLRGLSRPERLYQMLVPDLQSSFPPLRSLGEYVVSLPTPATRFVGRDAEVRQIVSLLADPAVRLLSLVGPGGTGKTRLAVAAAEQIGRTGSERFLDGVYFVPLAPLVAGDAMVSAVAQTVGFRFRQSEEPRRQLLDFLRRKRILLVMDNFEHLLDEGGADLPADILETAPDVGILATSRTRLNLPGESLINVGGLPAPDAYTIRRWQALAESEAEVETVIARAAADYAAVRLFAQSAARVRPGFRLRADNIADVARICRQVQGLPLGIELAAAWLEALSLPDIAGEIERNLDILATEQRGVPDRQRSIRAVFDTSWALLSDRERAILPMLSVFRGAFAREAAEFVAAATPRDLLGLVNKSWLQPGEIRNTRYEIREAQEDSERVTRPASLGAPAGRFQLHALLRQYAEEKLAEMPELEEQARDRQARYFARFLESHLRRMLGREQARAFNAVAEEFDDIHQAWEWWAQRSEFGRLVDQMLQPLFIYATARFVGTDVAPLIDRAIGLLRMGAGHFDPAAADPLPAIRLACLHIARAAIYINYFSREFTPGDVDTAWAIAQGLGDEAPARLGFWYALLNLTYGWRIAQPPAVDNLRAYIAAPGQADEITVAFARQALARLLIREFAPEGELLEARRQVGEALAVFERLGNEDARAAACTDQSDISTLLGRYDEALSFLDRAQPAAEAIGNWGMTWIILLSRREVYLQQGQPERMFPIFDEMLAMSRRVGNFRLECWTLSWDSIYALRYHSPERALFKRQGAMVVAEQFGLDYDRAWSALELGDIYRVMGDAAAARRWFDSALPQFEQQESARGRAFYRRGLGDLALGRGTWAEAYEHHRAFLDWADGRDTWSHIYALSGVGRAATGLGKLDEALSHLRRALSLTVSGARRDTISLPVACLAHLAAAADRPALAARLAAAVAASPLTWLETRAGVRGLVGDAAVPDPDERQAVVKRLAAITEESTDAWAAAAEAVV
ncbi:MAG: hypothetical protein KA170_00350 [Candidatus Promineofilum sp.]|nr:hypothetical protein [Promineifilum sp.]